MHNALAAEVLRRRDAWQLVDIPVAGEADASRAARVPAVQPARH